MKKNNKKMNHYIMLAVLLVVVTLGYALLVAKLNINGLTGFKGAKWKVYWTNIQVSEGSVNGTATINQTNNKSNSVTVNATLEGIGDFYEFTLDAKNESQYEVMVSENPSFKIYNLVDGEDPEEMNLSDLPSYLKYSFTYDNGKEVKAKDNILINGTRKYKIRVELDENEIDEDNLPDDNLDLKFVFSVNYLIADETVNRTRATLLGGADFNTKIKSLSNGYDVTDENGSGSYNDSNITNIVRSNTLTSSSKKIISDSESDYVIYAWYNDGTIYVYTEAEEIEMNSNADYMFKYLEDLSNTSEISNWKVSTDNNVSMNEMFCYCYGITTLDLSGWDMTNVKNIGYMFQDCSGLTKIYVKEDWPYSNMSYTDSTFYDCYSLVGGAGTEYDHENCNGDYAVIDGGSSKPGYFTKKTD